MEIETIKMSSKGQIVVPQSLRESINAGEGTLFAVVGTEDTIILKKIHQPSIESIMRDLERVSAANRKKLEAKGLTEKDIIEAVERARTKRKVL